MLLATREQSTIRLIPSVCRAFGSLRDKEHKRDAMIERTALGAPRSKVFLSLLWCGCWQFSLLSKGFLCTFYADRKYQRALRRGRWLHPRTDTTNATINKTTYSEKNNSYEANNKARASDYTTTETRYRALALVNVYSLYNEHIVI